MKILEQKTYAEALLVLTLAQDQGRYYVIAKNLLQNKELKKEFSDLKSAQAFFTHNVSLQENYSRENK
jgi:hypothetical protein